MGFETLWTPEQDAQLTELRALGHTTRVISEMMGTTYNAVIGRARRLNLPKRPNPNKFKNPALNVARPHVAPRAPKITLPGVATAKPVVPEPIVTLRPFAASEPCCFPVGERRSANFYCDRPSVPGRVYCREHMDIAYVRGSSRASQQNTGA